MRRHRYITRMRLLFAFAILPACLLAACQGMPSAHPPTTFHVPAARYDLAMDAAASALRDRGFVVERFDARMGVVSALPEGIPTSAEWWKGNSPNLSEWETRANLQDLRHRPRCTLTPVDAQARQDYMLTIEVAVERLDTPTRRVNASFGHPATSLSEVPEHWRLNGVENKQWQAIGRDGELEQTLAQDIKQRLP